MEDRKDSPPEEDAKLDTNEMCSGKSSIPQIEKDDNTSSGLQSTQSELYTENVSCDLVELSSDDEVRIIDVKRKSCEKNLQADDQCSSGRTSPKDATCSVCLSEYDNKSFLDKCFHAFCYFCILQWSEIVRTCPLCKSSFTSIIHSVKSMDNYQQHFLSKPDSHVPTNRQQFQSDGRRFRYRTTLTEGHRQQQQQQMQSQQHQWNETDIWGQPARRRQAHVAAQRDRKTEGRGRRRTIYRNNLWVQRVTQTGRPRQREISPEFFRSNPACTHRLIPWLTRDLRALLNDVESHVSFVLQIILSLINKVELSSEEFSRQLQPFLFDKTDHFIHEFIGFARSPFDMTAYDERAQYSWPSESEQEPRDTPTVFHSQTSGWHTPVPGPSGETLWQTDWNRDSPARQTVNNRWSPSSSPGTSGLNGRAGLERTVTISLSNSSVSPQTTLVDIEPTTNYQASNASSDSIGRSNRKRSSKETVGEKTQVETENKHQYHHYHRNSHKHKHERKESKRSSEKRDRGKLCGDTNHVDNGLGPSCSTNLSIVSSEFCSSPQEFIVISSDTSTSPVSSTVRPGPSCNDATQFQRRKEGSGSRSKSGLRLLSKGRGVFQEDKRSRSHSVNAKTRSRDRSLSVEERAIEEHRRWRSNSRERRLRDDSQRLSPSRKSGKHGQEKIGKSSLSPSQTHCKRKTRGEKIDSRRTKEYGRSRSRSGSYSRNSRSRHSRSQKSRTRDSRSRRSRSRSRGSQSHKSRSSRNSHSRSRDSRNLRSNSQSRYFSRACTPLSSRTHHSVSRSRSSSISTANSESKVRESVSHSNDAIKREIEDLESRIVADKKRLLRLLMKKEQAETA